jgi:excisionase family DNA binding protein
MKKKEWYTIDEMANEKRVSGNTIRNWIADGNINTEKLKRGGRRKSTAVRLADIDDYLNSEIIEES